jgi:hypothetical protein
LSNHSRIAAVRHAAVAVVLLWVASPSAAADSATVSGVLTANGETVELPHVYVWPEKEGFYDASDPTWNILFVSRELGAREIGEHIWDAAWVHIGITETAEFTDTPTVQVYIQSIKLSPDAGGNISGGTYPEIEVEAIDTERISGRVWHTETQESFDDTYSYDFTFSAPLSDPDAPIGDPLPAGGGEPGRAYLKWIEVVHSGDLDALRSIVPPEMVEQLDSASAEEAQEQIGFMQEMTPADVRILGGSTDGEIALLEIEGMMDGEKVTGEIEMTRMGEFWMPTRSSM